MTRNSNLRRCTERCFLESEFEIIAKVGTSLNPAAAAARARTKDVAETKQIAEDIAKVGKDIGIKACARSRTQACVAESVVLSALLRIA